jgi:transcriptional regulator with XRE-family HTH domain
VYFITLKLKECITVSLGEKLRNLRHKTKMTLQEQSEIFGVSMNTIYRWEHDLAVPRKSMLKGMADHYSVPVEWLLSESAAASLVSETEQKLLGMFRKLSENSQYKVLGYVERMCVEELGSDGSTY